MKTYAIENQLNDPKTNFITLFEGILINTLLNYLNHK